MHQQAQGQDLRHTVLDQGFCIGCGTCAYLAPDKYRIGFDDFGMLKAQVQPDLGAFQSVFEASNAGSSNSAAHTHVERACPFSDSALNEDELAEKLFPELDQHHQYVGKYRQCYVGHVQEGEFRRLGSSGGLGKWLLHELLSSGEVDYVIQVAAKQNHEVQRNLTGFGENSSAFEFQIHRKAEEVLSGAKSAYYPVTMVQSLRFIRDNPGRYAITAIPCFAKALRNLAQIDDVIQERVHYVIGIICGHLKSKGFAEAFGWQLGIAPAELSAIEFREKIPGKMANDKGIIATDRRGQQSAIRSSKELLGGNWGHNMFKYKACDYCDDVIAETADVAIGDAWLPEQMQDHKGGSVVVVRNAHLQALIENAIAKRRLALEIVTPETVVTSQFGGIRHRNEGLALRLHDDIAKNRWVPLKRVKPSARIPRLRRAIYRARVELRDLSHTAFIEAKRRHDFEYFRQAVKPLIQAMDHKPLYYRAARSVYRALKSSVKAVSA